MEYTKEYFIELFKNTDEKLLNGKTLKVSKVDGTQSIEGLLGGYESKKYNALRDILGIEPYALVADMGYCLYKISGLTSKERLITKLQQSNKG